MGGGAQVLACRIGDASEIYSVRAKGKGKELMIGVLEQTIELSGKGFEKHV
jgi:hypothetical protein